MFLSNLGIFRYFAWYRFRYQQKRVSLLYQKGKLHQAYNILNRMIEKNIYASQVGDLYIMLSELESIINHSYEKALEFIDKAAELGYECKGYYYAVRGGVLHQLGELEQALASFEKGVEEEPHAYTLVCLARFLSTLNDKRTLSVLERALKYDKNNSSVYSLIGSDALKSGDQNKARLMAEKAETLQSTAHDAFELSNLYYEMGEYQLAIKKFLDAEKLGYWEKSIVYSKIGHCYMSLNDKKMASEYFEKSLRYDPDNEDIREAWLNCQKED